jgi:hypothetical protein
MGAVFAGAWELFKKDVGWLLLASLIAVVVLVAILAAIVAIVAGLAANAWSEIEDMAQSTTPDFAGITDELGAAVLVLVVGLLIVQFVYLVFYGGLFKIVLHTLREGTSPGIAPLFAAFGQLGAFVLYWLTLVGISIGVNLVVTVLSQAGNAVGALASLASFVFWIWLGVSWVYVMPAIVDRELGFADAMRESMSMVKSVGWWRTFAALLLLALAVLGVMIALVIVAQVTETLALLLWVALAVLLLPYTVCYITSMYAGSGPSAATVPAPSDGLHPPAPPVPPAGTAYPPAPSAPIGAAPVPPAPPIAGPSSSAPPPAPSGGEPAPPKAPDDAWATAADPLAGAGTAVTAAAPAAPEPPAASPEPATPAPEPPPASSPPVDTAAEDGESAQT